MIYNDNPILPSDVLVALQNAYKKQANDTQQKTNELLGSFFVQSQEICASIMGQRCLPDDLCNALADLKTTTMTVTKNVQTLFGVASQKFKVSGDENVFGICNRVCECICSLAKLLENEPNKCRAVSAYISQLSHSLGVVLSILRKKDIAIRQYL